jgi:hypothetical protein
VHIEKRSHLKAKEKDEFEFPEPGLPPSPGKRRGGEPATKTAGRGGARGKSQRKEGEVSAVDRAATLEANAARWTGGPTILEDSLLFRTYRSGGGGLDTDTDTGEKLRRFTWDCGKIK